MIVRNIILTQVRMKQKLLCDWAMSSVLKFFLPALLERKKGLIQIKNAVRKIFLY